MNDHTTRERMNMTTREWQTNVVGLEFESILLVGGPLDGQTIDATVDADGPFRQAVAGEGVAQYQRVGRRMDGQARAEFIGYEDTSPVSLVD